MSSSLQKVQNGLKSILNVQNLNTNTNLKTNQALLDQSLLSSENIRLFLESWEKRSSFKVEEFVEDYLHGRLTLSSDIERSTVVESFSARFRAGVKKRGSRQRFVKKSAHEHTYSLVLE